MVKYVDKQWLRNRAKSIATENLKQYGKSKAWISILQSLNACVVCYHDDYVEIDYDLYRTIRDGERHNEVSIS